MTESKRSKLYAGFAGVAALALFTACGDDTTTPEEEEPAQDPTMEEAPAEDPMQESPAEEDPMEESPAEEGADVEGAGENNATSTLGLRSEEHTSELQSRGHLVCRLV